MSKKKPEFPTMKSRPLTYIHDIPVLRVKRYWDGLAEGKIYATKCKSCGKLYYPPQGDCPECLKSDMEWVELTKEGVLETFVAAFLKPQGFEHFETPYIIAIARVPEGVRVMGLLKDIDYKDAKVGMRVEISTHIGEDGFPVIVFRPKE